MVKMQTRVMTGWNFYCKIFMDLADKDFLKSSNDEEGIVFDETEEQENAYTDLDGTDCTQIIW
jgi:hypothetical protein